MSIGSNQYGECCRKDKGNNSPHLINEWILNKLIGANKILSVTPGWNSTFIVCANMDCVEAYEKESKMNEEDGNVSVKDNQNKEEKCNEVANENKNED
eukprot:877865_1